MITVVAMMTFSLLNYEWQIEIEKNSFSAGVHLAATITITVPCHGHRLLRSSFGYQDSWVILTAILGAESSSARANGLLAVNPLCCAAAAAFLAAPLLSMLIEASYLWRFRLLPSRREAHPLWGPSRVPERNALHGRLQTPYGSHVFHTPSPILN